MVPHIKANFAEALERSYGLTTTEAYVVYDRYERDGIVKIDPVTGGWTLTHGVFFDEDIVRRAIAEG